MSNNLPVGFRQNGMTLIELMIGMVLSLVLMAGVVQLFAANKASYRLTEAISEMQEGARYAMSRMNSDIRMGGYLGCTGRDRQSVVVNTEITIPPQFTPGNGVEGWDASGTGYGSFTIVPDAATSDASVSGWSTAGATTPVLDGATQVVSNSDVIRLWHIDGGGVLVDVNGTTVETGPGVPHPYAANDTMMLTDCTSVDIVAVCSVSGSDATLNCAANNPPINLLNQTGAALAFKLTGWIYYVGKRDGLATNPPSLFRREISANAVVGPAQELVEGVESIQLLYGEDVNAPSDGAADRYLTADNVTDWNNVVSVRVQLLMQSRRDDLVDGSQTFAFNGTTVTAADGRLRYPFVATVSVRNRSR